MNKFLLFSKNSCGPCKLVEKYFSAMNDERTTTIEKIDLEDFGSTPTQEAVEIAKKYSVTATPVLLVIKGDDENCVLEEHIGGVNITRNIKPILDKYYDKST
jgi:thiol-disulfide isomerase/thioredoxin